MYIYCTLLNSIQPLIHPASMHVSNTNIHMPPPSTGTVLKDLKGSMTVLDPSSIAFNLDNVAYYRGAMSSGRFKVRKFEMILQMMSQTHVYWSYCVNAYILMLKCNCILCWFSFWGLVYMYVIVKYVCYYHHQSSSSSSSSSFKFTHEFIRVK